MKVSEAINDLKVGDEVWVKGEVKELIKKDKLPFKLHLDYAEPWISINDEISLTEPTKKVEVPVYVAEFYEKYKDGLEHALVGLTIAVYEMGAKPEIEKWFSNSSNHPIETLIRMKDGYTVNPKRWVVKEGDLVIRKGKHEAKVYFVEGADEDGILLVNGIQDEYYSDEDCNLDNFYEEFRLLAKKKNLEAEVEGSVEEVAE